jgi:hypothetical protein
MPALSSAPPGHDDNLPKQEDVPDNGLYFVVGIIVPKPPRSPLLKQVAFQ